MRKFTIALVSIFLIASISGPAHSAQVTAKKYSSCADMLKKYPNGVAKDKKAKNKAIKGGFAKPKVSKTVYKKTVIGSIKTMTESYVSRRRLSCLLKLSRFLLQKILIRVYLLTGSLSSTKSCPILSS